MSPKKPPEPDREHYVSQTDGTRFSIPGRLAKVTETGVVPGGRCTVTFVRMGPGWVVYRLGIEEDPVLIAAEDAVRLAEGLGDGS